MLQYTSAFHRLVSVCLVFLTSEFEEVHTAGIPVDGGTLAMLCYDAIYLFPKPAEGAHWLTETPTKILLDQSVTRQAEGLAFYADYLVLTNEEGELHHLKSALSGASSYP